jgi:hypothetical protein
VTNPTANTESRLQPAVTLEEFERRFKARILARLSGSGTVWTQEQAEEAATEEYEAICEYDTSNGPNDWQTDIPEFSADESLSCWEDDGDE